MSGDLQNRRHHMWIDQRWTRISRALKGMARAL